MPCKDFQLHQATGWASCFSACVDFCSTLPLRLAVFSNRKFILTTWQQSVNSGGARGQRLGLPPGCRSSTNAHTGARRCILQIGQTTRFKTSSQGASYYWQTPYGVWGVRIAAAVTSRRAPRVKVCHHTPSDYQSVARPPACPKTSDRTVTSSADYITVYSDKTVKHQRKHLYRFELPKNWLRLTRHPLTVILWGISPGVFLCVIPVTTACLFYFWFMPKKRQQKNRDTRYHGFQENAD